MLKLFRTYFLGKYPDIKLIMPHAGAVMPILTYQMAEYLQNKEISARNFILTLLVAFSLINYWHECR